MIFQCISGLNYFVISIIMIHCVKNVRIRSYSGPHFFAFGLNTERYSASLPHFPAFGLNTERYSASLPHFFAFGLNTERYSASLPHFPAFGLNTEVRMRENAGKMRTRITPNANIFYAVTIFINVVHFHYY